MAECCCEVDIGVEVGGECSMLFAANRFIGNLEFASGSVCCSKPAPPVAVEAEEEEARGCEARNRHGIDLATTLERIQKNFVITDPRLPDNPIVTIHPFLFLAKNPEPK